MNKEFIYIDEAYLWSDSRHHQWIFDLNWAEMMLKHYEREYQFCFVTDLKMLIMIRILQLRKQIREMKIEFWMKRIFSDTI